MRYDGTMTKVATREFSQLCAALAGLTPAELEQVRLRATFLAGDTALPAPGVVHSDVHDWLLRGIEDELRRRGLLGRGHLPADRLRPDWAATAARLRADLATALRSASARDTAALGLLVARALADWLVAAGVPVGPKTMLQNADKIFAALDEAFPGYVGAGLLGACLDPELTGADY